MPNYFDVYEQLPSQDASKLGVLFLHVETFPSESTRLGLFSISVSVDAPNLEVLVRDKENNNISGATVELLDIYGVVEQVKNTAADGISTFFVSAECCIRISKTGKQSQFHRVRINAGGSQFMYTLLDSKPVVFAGDEIFINPTPSNPQTDKLQKIT